MSNTVELNVELTDVKISTEGFTDVTLAIDDTLGDDVRGVDWG